MRKNFSIIDNSNYYYLWGFVSFLVLFFSFSYMGLRIFVNDLGFLKQPFTHNLSIEYTPENMKQHLFEDSKVADYLQKFESALKVQKFVFEEKKSTIFLIYKVSLHEPFNEEHFKEYINQHSRLKFVEIKSIPSLAKHMPFLVLFGSMLLLTFLIIKLVFIAKTTVLKNLYNIETLRLMGAPKKYIIKEFQSYFFKTYINGLTTGVALLSALVLYYFRHSFSFASLWQMRFDIALNIVVFPLFILCLGTILSMIIFYSIFYRVK